VIDLASAVASVVDRLTAGGVAATADIRNLNPPAVLVTPPTIAWRFGRGADATWQVIATVGNTGADPAITALSELVDQAQAALGGAVTAGRPVDLSSIDGGAPLPGYELTFTTKIPERTPTP
jgi:hypothetical protein